MIAAGHPRLNFDFAEYQRRLPKHWLEKERTEDGYKPRSPDFPVKEWLIGRAAHAEAAYALLADRAERAEKGDERTPWPEFAEFNCAACHHDIPDEQRRTESYLGERKLGSLAWQTIWPMSYGGFLRDRVTIGERIPQKRLLDEMERSRPAGPKVVLPLAQESAKQTAAWRKKLVGLPDATVMQLHLDSWHSEYSREQPVDGDQIGQMLYALAGIQRAKLQRAEGKPHPAFTEAFVNVREKKWSEANGNIKTLREALIGPRPK
jgi:hypothetical protein